MTGMKLKRRVVLECIQPKHNHNKYYEISITEDKDDGDVLYYVDARWGRIEHFETGNPQKMRKAVKKDWDDAMAEVSSLMYEKLKKGYKVKLDKGKGSIDKLDSFEVEKSKEKSKTVYEVKTFERTEHVEIGVSEWWKNSDVNIEERAV